MEKAAKSPSGLRARKRRETRERIAENGFRLFAAKGYDATTLDEIATASAISRRTFFYYFKSKEEILLAQYDELLQALKAEMLKESSDQRPLDAGQNCLMRMASRYVTKETMEVDRLLVSTQALRSRKEIFYVEMERVLTESMCDLWPSEPTRQSLRIAAMLVIGTVRIAQDEWREDDGRHPLSQHLNRHFALLRNHL